MTALARTIRNAVLISSAGISVGTGNMPAPLIWPSPYIAADAQISSVGERININGIPAKIYRYTSHRRPEEVMQYFRDHMERNVLRPQRSNALPGQSTVAGRVGDFWVTLQVQQQSGRTVGTWSAIPQFVPHIAVAVHRPAGFPASAELLRQVDSFDMDKRSELALGLDPGPVDGVAQRMQDELRAQGYVREIMPRGRSSTDSYVSLYRKEREEILVALRQERNGTSVSINRISALEELK